MVRACLLVCALVAAVAPMRAIAQQDERSPEFVVAKNIIDRFNNKLDQAGDHGDLTNHAYRIVFLHDPSHLSAPDDPETAFVTKTVAHIVDQLNRFESQPGGTVLNPHFVEYYPYQLNLYPDESKQNIAVDSTAPAAIMGAIRTQPNNVDADGSTALDYSNPHHLPGHDNVGSRAELVAELRRRSDDRPDLIVQITTNAISRNFVHLELDAALRNLDADQNRRRMPDSSFVYYDEVDEDYSPPETPDQHIHLFFWLYGPQQPQPNLALVKATPAPRPPPTLVEKVQQWFEDPKNEPAAGLALLLTFLVVGGVAALTFWLTGSATVVVNGTPYRLKRGGELRIAAPGSTPLKSGQSYVLPADSFTGTASGTLAKLRYSANAVLLGTGSTLEAGGRSSLTSLPLPKGREVRVTLIGGTFKVPLTIKVS